MTNKLLIARILRIIFALMVLIWGILMWRELPIQIPVSFDASFLPDEYSPKNRFVWIFIFAIAALLPVPKGQIENAEENKNVKSVILDWLHTAIMCVIFITIMVLVKKNLK